MTTQTSLRMHLLGPVRAWFADSELRLGGPKSRAVLAALLLGRGRVLTVDELVDWVWGDHAPDRAEHAVRTYVSALRGEFDRVGMRRDWLKWNAGYTLRLPPYAMVDAYEFERLMKLADGEADPSRASSLLRRAESMFTGTALCGIGGNTAERHRSEWSERRAMALEFRMERDLECGRHHEVLPDLFGLMACHPLRERCHELALVALYRCGRQADALAVYEGIRTRLAETYGVDPAPRLRETHLRILRSDPRLDVPTTPVMAG